MYKRLPVPLDGSKLAESVLPHVQELVKQRGYETTCILLHVCEPTIITADTYGMMLTGIVPNMPAKWEDYARLEKERCKRDGEEYLKNISGSLQSEGLKVEVKVLDGKPGDEIVKFASRNIQLIVMSTHGHSGLNRLGFPSVTEKVVMGSNTPVFLATPPAHSAHEAR